jgi:hypothetical protein
MGAFEKGSGGWRSLQVNKKGSRDERIIEQVKKKLDDNIKIELRIWRRNKYFWEFDGWSKAKYEYFKEKYGSDGIDERKIITEFKLLEINE